MPYKDPAAHADRNIAYQRAYRAEHRAELNARKKAEYWANPEKFRAYARAFRAKQHEIREERQRLTGEEIYTLNQGYRRNLREQMIAAYGGHCACCGEDTYEFLAIDHINGVGRKLVRHGGRREASEVLLRRLRREGWPQEGYRLLCHNCNMSYGFYGCCPHQVTASGSGPPA